MHARIIGEVDRLGYVYCSECHPEALDAGQMEYPVAIWSDGGATDGECESCHQQIDRTIELLGA